MTIIRHFTPAVVMVYNFEKTGSLKAKNTFKKVKISTLVLLTPFIVYKQ